MSGALVAQAINESIGTAGFQGLDAILKEYLGLIAEQAGTARVPISRTINGHSLASDVDLDNNDVGAAPAGFGLGTDAYMAIGTMDLLNATTRNGWYQVYLPGSTLNNVYFNFAFLHVMNYAVGKHCVQELYPIGMTTPLVRKMQDGVWDAWESVNPPMQVGVEYRTTERYLGSPVYAKLIDVGILPNSTFKTFMLEEAVGGKIVGASVITYGTENDGYNYSKVETSNVEVTYNSDAGQLFLTYNIDNPDNFCAYILIKYCKA